MIMGVIALNGGPSVFTDTDDYFVEGRTFAITIAETLHLKAPPPVPTDPDDIADAKEAAADLHMSHTEIGARSPYYGLLLYSTHKLGTLWLTALVQSLVGAWLAFLFWRTALPGAKPWTAYVAEASVAFASTLPFFAAFAMPDVFAGYVAMAVVMLLVFWERLSKVERGMLATAAGVMMTFHTSQVLNTLATAALAGLIVRFFIKYDRARALASFITVGLALTGAILATGIYKEAVKLKTGDELRRPPFLAMRVLADGSGKKYLNESCDHGATWALCPFKALPLDNSQDLLWSDDRKKGIFNVTTIDTRVKIEEQENAFVVAAVAHHPFLQIGASLDNWGQQLLMYYVDDPIKNPHYYLTNDYWSTTNLPLLINTAKDCGRDHWGCGFKLTDDESIWLHGGILAISLLVIVGRLGLMTTGWLLSRRDPDGVPPALSFNWDTDAGRATIALSLVVAVTIINAFVCGALSGPFPRYQARLTWGVTEGAALAALSLAPVLAALKQLDWLTRLRAIAIGLWARRRDLLEADFLRFGLVGVAGFTVDYAVLHSLVAFAGLNPFAARFISFPIAVAATWLLNRSFTFRKPSAHGPVRQAVYYVAVQCCGGVANIAVYAAALVLAPALKHYLPVALAFGSAAGLCVTFAGSKYIAFRPAEVVEVEAAEAG